MTADPLRLDLADLRHRRSAKWRTFDPDVLPLWVAEMDVALAPPVAEALRTAIERSDTGYRSGAELPAALAGFASRRLGWDLDPGRVTILADCLTGIAQSLIHLTGPGDGVVVTPPVYPPFFNVTRDIARREVVEVPLVEGRLDLDGLRRAFARPQVTAFLMCHPHNPTGTVASRTELIAVAELAREYGVTVVSDEIWAPMPLRDTVITPYLSLGEDLVGPDVALVSASKSFNLAGLKCAQLVAGSDRTAQRLTAAIPLEITYGAGHLGVIASVAAYEDGDDWLDALLAALAQRADLLADLLADRLPEVSYRVPDATYLAWMDCRALGLGDDPAATILERGRVALNAGPTFGAPGAGFARLNLATSPAILAEAVDRMALAVGR